MKKAFRNSKKNILNGSLYTIVLILIDQITKILAQGNLENNPVALIPGVFDLYYLRNESAAFSLDPVTLLNNIFHFSYFTQHPESFLTCKMWFFYIFTILVIGIIIYFFCTIPDQPNFIFMNIICILFVSGATGNLIDRIAHHYVIDFFYFELINFPVFNVADIYVTVGAALFILVGLFYYKEKDFALLFSFGREKGECDE